jgi:hypothetical protein
MASLPAGAYRAILAAAMVIGAAVVLHQNRSGIFFLDELVHLYNSPDLDLRYVFEPVNGHLGITPKLVYKLVLETFGADYTAFRIVHVIAVMLSAGVFYAVAERRVGPPPALAAALVLVFFGAAYPHFVIPVGFGIFVCIAAALGALLALEREDRIGDALACVLLLLSIATYTVGLAFAVGVAVSVLIRRDRAARAWIFLVPLALYAAWWVWASGSEASSATQTELSNILLLPNFAAESLAVVIGALVGLGYDFIHAPFQGDVGSGRVLAAAAVVLLAIRLRRGNLPASLWVSLSIAIAYWALGAVAVEPGFRGPESSRYLYPGAIIVLLIATDAARGLRVSPGALTLVAVACAISVAANLALLRDGGRQFRVYSAIAKAQFGVIELTRDRVDPDFDPVDETRDAATVSTPAGVYLRSADRYGAVGFSEGELRRQSNNVRGRADTMLAAALGVDAAPARREPTEDCRRASPNIPDGPVLVELAPGGATLEAEGVSAGSVALSRFADSPHVALGELAPGEPVRITVPTDSGEQPWTAAVTGTESVLVCAAA